MSVDRDEVERIAGLARLRLEDGEAERLTDEMNRILDHAARLRGLSSEPSPARLTDDSGITESAGERGASTRHPDAEQPDPLSAGLESFAPRAEGGFFVVPPPSGVGAEPPTDPVD